MSRKVRIVGALLMLTVAFAIFSAFTGAVNWPSFSNNLQNTGFNGSSTGIKSASKLWNYTLKTSQIYSSPAVDKDRLYIGARFDSNLVYALNASNGSQIWNFSTGGDVFSSPAIGNSTIYVGSTDNNVYALNASNGSQIWSFSTGDSIYSSPTVSKGFVYIGSNDNKVYALYASNGSQVWSFSTSSFVHSAPTRHNDRVYFGGGDNNVYSLYASNGSQVWSFSTSDIVRSYPAVTNSTVYIVSDDGNIYALNSSTGSEIWSYDISTSSNSYSSPAFSSGAVYVGSRDNNVYAFNSSTGSSIWNFSTDGEVWSTPAVVDNTVYIGSRDSTLYAINRTNGSEIWSQSVGGEIQHPSPAVGDRTVYIGSDDNNVYAFSTDTSPPSLTIHHPPNKTISDTTPDLNVTASETVDTWLYNVDSDGNTTFTPNITLSTLSDGKHNVTVWANDTAGNYGRSITQFRIDSVPPNINFAPPTPSSDSFSNSNLLEINVTATDNDDLRNISLRLYNSSDSLINSSNTTTSPLNQTFTLNDGTYKFNATAYDSVNSTNTTDTRNITIDTKNPSISLSLSTTSITTGDSVEISCSASDSGSGISSNNLEVTNPDGETFNPSCNKDFTDTDEGGKYTVKFKATDNAGNTNTKTKTFQARGGGGGAAGEKTPKESKTWIEPTKGHINQMNVTHRNISLDAIRFTCQESADLVTITVRTAKPKEVSEEVGIPENVKVYQYLNVETKGLDICSPKQVETIFSIVREWLEARENINIENVDIYRYADNWQKIDTRKVRDTDINVQYRAKLPDFSYIAIAVKHGSLSLDFSCPFECCTSNENYTTKNCGNSQICRNNQCVKPGGTNQSTNKTTKRTGTPDKNENYTPWILLAILIIIAAFWWVNKD